MVSTAQDIIRRYGIDQDFAASIESLGNDLGVDPMYLANVMYSESQLDPSKKNKAGSGATGLIQFMPQTAANLGTTTDELSRMTQVEQMEYVRRYFSADNLGAGRLRDLQNDPSQHNVNMAVFLPSMIGKPVDTQIPQKYWRQNGSIRTPADYTRSAEERVNAYIQSKPVDTQTDPIDTQTDKMLFEEQPEDTFRPEVVPASLDTDAVISSTDEEALEVDDTLMAEHEEKIRRGDAPRGSKPTEEGGYYTEGEYGFRTNPEGEVVADSEVNSLENVATNIGERLRTILGNNENSEVLELNAGGLVESARELVESAREGVYSLGSRGAARELRDTVAKELGVYETSKEARSIADKYRLSGKETDTLRHILGAGLLKYSGKDYTQPLLEGTEVLDKLQVSAERVMDSDAENKYRKSYYDQSIEEANRDIVNYQVGAALAKQYDTKDDFINSAVQLVKELSKGKTPVVVDQMPTRFGFVDRELTPQLSTGVVYNPEELKRKGLIYDPKSDAMVSSRTVLSPPIPEPRPENLKKAEGGSVEKKAEFIKKKDDDVPDPPPGATPEEVADDIPAYLSTGEYVLPANVVRYIGLKNITGMHQRALAELQQMEDLDIIENVDENGYVEEDDDEMDYMEPEGVVEIVVAEHHPKGLMAKGFAEGGMIEGYKYVPGVGYRLEDTAVTELQESAGDLGVYVSGVGFVRPPESDDRPMPSQKSSQADAEAEAIVSILDGIHSVYDDNEDVTIQQFFGKDEEGNLIGPDDPRTQEQLFKLSEAAGRQTFGIIQGRGENSDMAPRDKGITRFLRNVTGPNLSGRVISDEYLAKGLTKLKKDIPEKVYEREDVTGKFYNPEDPQDIFSGDLLKSGDTGPARKAMTLSPEGKSLSVADMMAASIGKEYAQQGRSDTPGGGNTSFGGAGVKSYPGTQAGWNAFTSDVSQGFKDLGSFMTFGGLATTIGKGLMNAFNGRQTFTSVGSQGLPASIAKGGFVTKQGITRPRSCD
jgi:hypothetical protein